MGGVAWKWESTHQDSQRMPYQCLNPLPGSEITLPQTQTLGAGYFQLKETLGSVGLQCQMRRREPERTVVPMLPASRPKPAVGSTHVAPDSPCPS